MTETLVIRLADREEQPVTWLLLDSAGDVSGSVQSGALSAAAPPAAGRRVVVLVPGVDVSLAEPELPVRGGARLAQVVPFALEEQIADDLDSMHFAVGRREGEGTRTPVAVVTRERVQTWLAQLRAAQIEPAAMYADSALLPANPSQSVLLVENGRLYVRHPQQQPFVLHLAPLATAFEVADLYSIPADPQTAPANSESRHVIAYIGEGDWERQQSLFETVREHLATLNIQLLRESALPLLAQQLSTQSPINLLQGAFAVRSQFGESWQRWRIAALLLAGLVALNLVGKGVELWRLKQTERSLDAVITQTFREAMPGEQNALNARRRMEARLMAVRGGSGDSGAGILSMLSTVGTAFAQTPSAKLDALSYRANTLDLRVRANDVGSLSKLESLVQQGGLSAQLQSSNSNGAGVEGRMQITRGNR